MAKKQVATVEVFCNAKQAVQILNEYKRLAADTLTKIEQKTQRVNQIRAKGANATKAEVAEMKRLTQELKKDEQAFRMYNSAVQKGIDRHVKLRNVMKDLSGSKLKDLKMALRELQKMMNNVSNDTPKRAEVIRNSIQKVQAQITKLTGETGKFGKTHSSVWQTAVRKITAYVGVFGSFNFIKSKITEVIQLNNKLSDQMADIRKVSGLAMDDIRQLTMNLTKIDTRTTLEELNKIAYAGAKLGFGNQGIGALEEFTKAANQVNVALKEDLGEEALTALSKITENMGLIKKMGVENAMLATGSAMFKLASTSTAAAGPIVEVTKRIVPMAKSMGLATYEVLALASSADSLQLPLEVTGTALSKFFAAMQTNHNLIEESLSITPGTLESWIKQGKAMDAILLIFDKMKEKGNMSQLQPIVKLLGGDGARLITVLQSMSQEVDRVRSHLNVSKEAFMEATAVTEEYNIQQDTAAALIERSNNLWRNAFVNPEASESVKDLARSWYDFTKSLLATPEAMMSAKVGLDAIIGSLKLLIQLIPGIVGFGLVKLIGGLTSALGLGKIATEGFTAAWKNMSTAMKANWIGLAVAALMELYHQIRITSAATEEAEQRTITATKAVQNAIEKADQEIQNLSRLKAQIDDVNISQEQRNLLLSKIKSDYDIYLSYLGVEINTVDDLARHYDALTKVMRQRFAYQEQEEYKRTKMGGEGGSRMNRRMAGAALAKELKKLGLNADDQLLNYITKTVKERTIEWERWKEEHPGATAVPEDFKPVDYEARRAVGIDWSKSYKSDRYAKSAYHKFINAIREETLEDMEIENAFAAEKGDFDIDKFLREQVKGDFRYEPDKAAQKAAAAAAAEARRNAAQARREQLQKLRADLKDAETEAQAIIDKINEFYYLQEETIENAVSERKITREIADRYLLDLKLSKNSVLANARRAIAGKMDENKWQKIIDKEMPDNTTQQEFWAEYAQQELIKIMVDQGEWSTELAGEIIKTDLTDIHNLLARFNGSEAVLGLRSTASFDKIMKNAAVNERDNARIRSQIAEEVEKILLEYNYVEQAQKSFHANLIGLGIMRETYEQYAKRMQEEAKTMAQQEGVPADAIGLRTVGVTAKYISPEQQLLQQFLSQGSKPYRVNPQNDRDLYVWLQNLMSNYDYDEQDDFRYHTEGWVAKGFPQLEEWVKDIDKYRPEIQKFYFSLITWEDEYYDAKKKAYDRSKRLMEQEWDRSGNKQRYDDLEWELSRRGRERKMPGYDQGETFGQMGGFTALEEDPELALYRAKIEASQLYLQQLQQEHADELLIREAQRAENEAELAYQEQVMAKINERINKLHEWTDPIEQFGSDVGTALGESLRSGESMAEGMEEALRKVALAWGQTTIKIVEELMMQRIKQKLLNKAMQHEETAHQTTMSAIEQSGAASRQAIAEATGDAKVVTEQVTNATIEGEQISHNVNVLAEDQSMAASENAVNTSRAAGKTLADLGWWGIPLVAVIVALLNMLLQAALAKGSKKSNNANTKINTKLVSGMLTYDEGNVSSYVGTDGHVYNARRTAMPQGTALVTSPIATTVNGQPSLVAERGPEIVIGRRTTRHIMLNEPSLLQHLANLDRHRTAARYRPFDDGNLSDLSQYVAVSQQPASQQSGTDEQTRQTLEALTAAVIALQARLAQPIEAKINKYGTGGLIDEVQSGLKFMNRYRG